MLSGITYNLLRSTQQLHAAIPQWSALWREDPQASPFMTPEWLVPWWHQFGQDNLRAVVIARDGIWIGFLPFYIFRDPYTRERQLLQLGVSSTDYLDGLFAPVCTAGQIREAIALLLREPGWDVFCASQLPAHSRLFHAVRQMNEGRMRQFEGENCSRMRAVPVADQPQKMRRNILNFRNRAQRAGKLELQVADAGNWAEAFGALRRLHTERWLERGETGVLSDERVLAWHCEALPLLERSGLLRLSSLRLNREIIGVLYSLIDPPWRPARTQYFYLSGFSTRFADLAPGTLLLALATEHAASEGVEIIDMLRGYEVHTQFWHLELTITRGIALENAASVIDIGGSEMAA